MKRHWNYLKFVLRHKWLVFVYGRKLGVPITQLIAHDWTKFMPIEWGPYSRWLESGIPWSEKEDAGDPEFDRAWDHHKSQNAHHWQYWMLDGTPLEMPGKYALELTADWLAQNNGNVIDAMQNIPISVLHPSTKRLIVVALENLILDAVFTELK